MLKKRQYDRLKWSFWCAEEIYLKKQQQRIIYSFSWNICASQSSKHINRAKWLYSQAITFNRSDIVILYHLNNHFNNKFNLDTRRKYGHFKTTNFSENNHIKFMKFCIQGNWRVYNLFMVSNYGIVILRK